MSNTLIIGGTAGLGLELGRAFQRKGNTIHVTGRQLRTLPHGFSFHPLTIGEDSRELVQEINRVSLAVPIVDLLIYSAGFYENGHLATLSQQHIGSMINVGLTAPALIVQHLLREQGVLPGLIVVTSTSQWRAREHEPLYAASKAGLGMLAESLSLDPAVKKTLVIAPAGLNTALWKGEKRSGELLNPMWVAEETLKLWKDNYAFRLAQVLRDPARVELLTTR